jgi:[ribosomal protein S18]-alanine N-acetyltransferase
VNASLRPYRPDDFEALYRIDHFCYPRGIAYSRRMLRAFLDQPHSHCVVAELGGKIVGFILTESEWMLGHIITIDVLEKFRRTRVGSALLHAAEEHLAGSGVREVELETATSNHAAIAFWQKHGYRTRGVYKGYYLGRADALAMLKTLAPRKETG